MKRYSRPTFIALVALFALSFPIAFVSNANAQDQAEEVDPGYTEEEYSAWETADKEPDLEKRAQMLIEVVKKYPESKILPHAEASYRTMLFELSQAKNYALLEPLAEKWLMVRPGSKDTITFIAQASEKLGHDKRCVECLEELYQMEPTATMAFSIMQMYKKMNNQAKVLQWSDVVFKAPEYAADYLERYEFVRKYTEANNIPKAAEYAQLTLKSADQAKNLSAEKLEHLKKVRHACYHVIAMDLMEKDKCADAIETFKKALAVDKYGEGYYYIAQCYEKLGKDKVEDFAIPYYARAELHGGEVAPKAKARLETLYKALHNNTIIGIDKVYRRVKESVQ